MPVVSPPVTPSTALTRELLVAWGEAFGRAARPPLLVALTGDIGAGKTTLVQAICRGYGVDEPVTSPTFALVHQYGAPLSPVYHLDLYRLGGARDLTNIGWNDIVTAEALVLIEWADRAESVLPPECVRLRLEHIAGDDDLRFLSLVGAS